jgi:radical SAM superfamily enzyme YgiQ (UPF0313 family)
MQEFPSVRSLQTSGDGTYPALGPHIRALLVWPAFPDSFWSFRGMLPLVDADSVLPPLGLITLAALCPSAWELRLVDCSIEELKDEDLRWADLVMISGMYVQREGMTQVAQRARALNRRIIIGGPYASSQPDLLLQVADHVVTGEPDEVFHEIARDLEQGGASRLYEVIQKPDITKTPTPRFDLLQLGRYASMAFQFSRGCPFQCEFCDIITLYGRRPRTKTSQQMLVEFEALYKLGWRKSVFIVDDNFLGNHHRALELSLEIAKWQKDHGWPFALYTEASMDLAQRDNLVEAMVKANFLSIFVGIESPRKESLIEAKKYQNVRMDPLTSIRSLQRRGLWVMGGFIVGFDSDPADIFEQQRAFVEQAAIPWAMSGFLQAPPKTALFDRMKLEGRLDFASQATSNFSVPNFRTVLPLSVLVAGYRTIIATLYDAEAFFERAFRSLAYWKVTKDQHAPTLPVSYQMGTFFRSMWKQGFCSSYRRVYWKFLSRLLALWGRDPVRLWWGFTVLCSAHHFLSYKQKLLDALDVELIKAEAAERNVVPMSQTGSTREMVR